MELLKKKRIMAFTLALALVFSLVFGDSISPVAYAAEEEPITLDSGTYNVSELDSNKSYMIKDAEVTFVIDQDKALLAKATEDDWNKLYIQNSKLTIKGDKTLTLGTADSNNPINGNNGSELTIESGNVEIYDDGATYVFQGKELNIKGGTLTVHNIYYGIGAKTVNISGGVVNSVISTGGYSPSTVNITGGTVKAIGKEYGIGQDYRSGRLYNRMTLNISGGDVYAEATDANRALTSSGYSYLYSGVSVYALNITGGKLEAKVSNEDQVAVIAVNGITKDNVTVTEPSGGNVESCSIEYGGNTFNGYTIGTGSGGAKHVIINSSTSEEPTTPPAEEPTTPVTPPADPATPATTYVSMYRLYNPNSGEHFYTSNASERDNIVKAGWRYEGIAWNAPKTSDTPVYRLYNPNAGDHHYTTSEKEKDNLVKVGWKYEGIGWYSTAKDGKPLYRLYNPNAKAGSHHYTTSAAERDNLKKLGWRDEGIAWYGGK
ncbi:MAG: hypothetical protein IJ224_06975 [Lachnospiraceae bacterium]|nr:hypothetical protein [Lachnospiraceae bacterium]